MRGITGRVAAIKWGYFDAASVEGYSVRQDRGGWSVSGALVPGRVDAFKLAQRPLFFVATFKGGAWRWPIHQLTTTPDGRFTAELGPVATEGPNGLTRSTTRH
jgi:hypothetical protein